MAERECTNRHNDCLPLTKRAIHIILLVLCAVVAQAQPRLRQPEYWLGFQGGVSAGTVMFVPKEANMTPITNACVLGGNGGLVFRYIGHKYCAFQMELNYEHRGWAQGNASIGRTVHSLHYIELPILMHLNFGSTTCRWYFDLGPQIGYCIYDESNSIDKPFDWGLAAGTGVEIQSRRAGMYLIGARFDFSLGGVYGTSVTDSHSMANPMDLSINVGWLMPVKSQAERKRARLEREAARQEREAARRQRELEQEYQTHTAQ